MLESDSHEAALVIIHQRPDRNSQLPELNQFRKAAILCLLVQAILSVGCILFTISIDNYILIFPASFIAELWFTLFLWALTLPLPPKDRFGRWCRRICFLLTVSILCAFLARPITGDFKGETFKLILQQSSFSILTFVCQLVMFLLVDRMHSVIHFINQERISLKIQRFLEQETTQEIASTVQRELDDGEYDLRWESLCISFVVFLAFYPQVYFLASAFQGVGNHSYDEMLESIAEFAQNNSTKYADDPFLFDQQKRLFAGVVNAVKVSATGAVLNNSLINAIIVNRITNIWLVDVFNGKINWREICGAIVQLTTFLLIIIVLTMEPTQITQAFASDVNNSLAPYVLLIGLLSCFLFTIFNMLGTLNAILRMKRRSSGNHSSSSCIPSWFIEYRFWKERLERMNREDAQTISMTEDIKRYKEEVDWVRKESEGWMSIASCLKKENREMLDQIHELSEWRNSMIRNCFPKGKNDCV
mmetsp:Transcript_12028/g.18327  ORF Transcript_12028/g.18327 Transcript_12028/m.18327 type:complete len:475 (-) Transcript_12028:149-1573(-)